MDKLIIYLCFYWPLVSSCLNIQNFISKSVSPDIAQIVAYLNVILVTLGIFLFRKKIEQTSTTNKLWFVFYILYYSIGMLATGINGFQTSIIATLIPVIYFSGFHILLSNKRQLQICFAVITISLFIVSLITIIFYKINFDFESFEFHPWALDRAEGLYGDANNAALASILAYIFFNKFFQPSKRIWKLLKIIILALILYSLFLTFSTTGLAVFTIVFFIMNYKYFNGLKIIFLFIAVFIFYIGVLNLKNQTSNLNLSKAQIEKINNISNLLTFDLDKVDNSGRGDLIENILPYLYKNPIIGNGINFSAEMRGHNTYVGLWVDAGIFTFLFFIFMLFYYFSKTFGLVLNIRLFAMSLLIALCIFMISLQTVLNQPYLIVLFPFLGYLIDNNNTNKQNSGFLRSN